MFLEFLFEPFKERKGVGRGPGKAGQDAVLIQTADFPGSALHDGIPEADLAVTRDTGHLPAANGENRCRMGHDSGILLAHASSLSMPGVLV